MLTARGFGLLLACWTGVAAAGPGFDFEVLKARARERAAAAHQPPAAAGTALGQIEPARLDAVALKPARAPWSMRARFVPLPLAPRPDCAPTQFRSIQASGVEHFVYRPQLFDWTGAGVPPPGPAAAGFCGFRVLYPAADGTRVELARFTGDALQLAGADGTLGVQAPVAGEIGADGRVQPVPFREFWLVRPAAGARQLRVYALAESPALVAAVQIDLKPGAVPRADVVTALYPRAGLAAVLLAPLAGEFVQGELRPAAARPLHAEWHDADGLSVRRARGGWLWRPLDNPGEHTAHGLAFGAPRGYGLSQRDRDAAHYAPGAVHPRQPDVWLQPEGSWGEGELRLVASPARPPGTRNVLAGFVPAREPVPGEELRLRYRLTWSADNVLPRPGGWVVATRSGAADGEARRRYAIDFAGPSFGGLPAGAVPEPVVDVGRGGRLRRAWVQANPHTGGWRLFADVARVGDGPLPLRAYLQHADEPLTETWGHVDLPR
jgi:glucans biosynthesis protein